MYTPESARHVMNALGRAKIPFAFVIPYGLGENADEPILLEPAAEHLPRLQGMEGPESAQVAAQPPSPPLFYQLPGAEKRPRGVPPLPHQVIWHPEPPAFGEYRRAFDIVQHHLHRGDSYLTNLSMATPVRCNLTLEQMFSQAQAPYKLLVPGRFACFSPEPFVHLEGESIRTFPMKGTVSHQADVPRLLADPKEQREHATVVDLLRNDLAIVGRSVTVERYRYVEKIPTLRGELFATSSAIAATLDADWAERIGDILLALLPAGSVTGAPKTWTCRAIAEAEPVPRRYYTGVFGYFDGASLRSAVSIRLIEQQQGEQQYLYRSGGGITTLSRAQDEYRELCAKVYLPLSSRCGGPIPSPTAP